MKESNGLVVPEKPCNTLEGIVDYGLRKIFDKHNIIPIKEEVDEMVYQLKAFFTNKALGMNNAGLSPDAIAGAVVYHELISDTKFFTANRNVVQAVNRIQQGIKENQ